MEKGNFKGTYQAEIINPSDFIPTSDEEVVNHPPHYNKSGIECIQGIEAALGPEEFKAYLKGNVIKYIWRSKYTGGKTDHKKAQWYLNLLTKKEEDS